MLREELVLLSVRCHANNDSTGMAVVAQQLVPSDNMQPGRPCRPLFASWALSVSVVQLMPCTGRFGRSLDRSADASRSTGVPLSSIYTQFLLGEGGRRCGQSILAISAAERPCRKCSVWNSGSRLIPAARFVGNSCRKQNLWQVSSVPGTGYVRVAALPDDDDDDDSEA